MNNNQQIPYKAIFTIFGSWQEILYHYIALCFINYRWHYVFLIQYTVVQLSTIFTITVYAAPSDLKSLP